MASKLTTDDCPVKVGDKVGVIRKHGLGDDRVHGPYEVKRVLLRPRVCVLVDGKGTEIREEWNCSSWAPYPMLWTDELRARMLRERAVDALTRLADSVHQRGIEPEASTEDITAAHLALLAVVRKAEEKG